MRIVGNLAYSEGRTTFRLMSLSSLKEPGKGRKEGVGVEGMGVEEERKTVGGAVGVAGINSTPPPTPSPVPLPVITSGLPLFTTPPNSLRPHK